MTFNWFKIFNLVEFLGLNLVSKTYFVILEGVGQKDILVTRGNEVSIVYEDVLLPVEFKGDNPFIVEGTEAHYAVYKAANGDVSLGIEAQA